MEEYISRKAVMEAYEEEQRKNGPWRFETLINSVPASDVAPVIHAKWENMRNPYCGPNCSHCKSEAIQDDYFGGWFTTDFCPRCGAKMDLTDN